MTQPCSRCGAPWISGLHECPDGRLAVRAPVRDIPCNRCGGICHAGLKHTCPDGVWSLYTPPPERMPYGNEGATLRQAQGSALTGTPDPAVDRIVIQRLAVLLGGVSYATAREWLIYHAARFRGMGEEDFKALIKD